MADVVLDASAVLALIFEEPGSDEVEPYLPGALISTVNVAEVFTRLINLGMPEDTAGSVFEALQLSVISFDQAQAVTTAAIAPATRPAGLSLGDRACLALARGRALRALTADRAWGDIADEAGVSVSQIR